MASLPCCEPSALVSASDRTRQRHPTLIQTKTPAGPRSATITDPDYALQA